MIRIYLLIFLLIPLFSNGQMSRASKSEEKLIWKELKKETGFKKVFKKYKKYRFEIIFTQIDRTIEGGVKLKNFHLGDSVSYFYPASTVKLPTAISIMEMMKNEPFYNVNLSMKLRLDTMKTCGYQYENGKLEFHRFQPNESIEDILKKYRISLEDFLSWNQLKEGENLIPFKSYKIYHRKSRVSLSELIKEMLVYSDNESYNKLFEVVGGSRIDSWLNDKGFSNCSITRKFAYCVGEEKSHTIPFDILNDKDVIIYHGEERSWKPEMISKTKDYLVGEKYFYDGEWMEKPRDFFDHNKLPLSSLHEMMQRLLFPSSFSPEKQFGLSMQNYRQLIRDLGMYPNEDLNPRDSIHDNMEDGSHVFLFRQFGEKALSGVKLKDEFTDNIRIINIIGQAYGFSTDCMYFTDNETKTEFMLSARIYTNKNEVLGDDEYEYEEIALPLMEHIGNYFFEREKQRKKEVLPNFTIMRSLFDQ